MRVTDLPKEAQMQLALKIRLTYNLRKKISLCHTTREKRFYQWFYVENVTDASDVTESILMWMERRSIFLFLFPFFFYFFLPPQSSTSFDFHSFRFYSFFLLAGIKDSSH